MEIIRKSKLEVLDPPLQSVFRPAREDEPIKVHWEELILSCSRCFAEFQLKPGDEPLVIAQVARFFQISDELGANDLLVYNVACPCCGAQTFVGWAEPIPEDYWREPNVAPMVAV
jgi:hypothetical protein